MAGCCLLGRHCEENLLFWLEAEDFKDIPGKDFLKIRARKIVNKYIVEDAKQQVGARYPGGRERGEESERRCEEHGGCSPPCERAG